MSTPSRLGKMPAWQRQFVLFGMLSTSITGVIYLLGHEFHIQAPVFGNHAVLIWHGIAALGATLALGSVLPNHLKAGWKSKRKLVGGISQFVLLFTLLISGALLYYGPEEIRETVILTHWLVGLAFFAIFLIHGINMRKAIL